MYVLTTIDGEPYKRNGMPAIYNTSEELERAVKSEGLENWAARHLEREEAAELIKKTWFEAKQNLNAGAGL
jgi:hypothetical protein